ncbi:hypothetical protein GYMLUDRAFT_612991 [Collybiopsis luxurians FD-317 M1]|uniref:Uncharacterized protein n=1 Tax=Collybiopsis luxurians FD-317 M1 TaxID=944289 RepID=A0A0D0BWW3_9AGAR|nr:hypothetical protein GYMLUDRAFT_612991 [Collybiopsis luxurians FD-317 M1]
MKSWAFWSGEIHACNCPRFLPQPPLGRNKQRTVLEIDLYQSVSATRLSPTSLFFYEDHAESMLSSRFFRPLPWPSLVVQEVQDFRSLPASELIAFESFSFVFTQASAGVLNF